MDTYPASFYDGESAGRREVSVRLSPDALDILDGGGKVVAHWPYGELRRISRDQRDALRLSRRGERFQRLVIHEVGVEGLLFGYAPHLIPRPLFHRSRLKFVAIWAAGVGALVLLLAHGVPLIASGVASIVSPAWEKEVGERMAEQIVRTFHDPFNFGSLDGGLPLCRDEPGHTVLEDLAARLAQGVGSPHDFEIWVADTEIPIINAFAAPGGYIVIFKGLIDFVESGDELAGVLAHEMGHVNRRHPTERWVQFIALGVVSNALVGGSGAGAATARTAELMVMLSYSRNSESEADAAALDMMNAAGVSGRGLADFFERMNALLELTEVHEGVEQIARYFTSHPPSAERSAIIGSLSTASGAAMPEADWQAVKAICG
ncbi:MAG: M48 family metallopeptidase [Alphaproteobacteria bacterium]